MAIPVEEFETAPIFSQSCKTSPIYPSLPFYLPLYLFDFEAMYIKFKTRWWRKKKCVCVKKFDQKWSVKDGEALSWTSCFELIVHAGEWIDYEVDGKN